MHRILMPAVAAPALLLLALAGACGGGSGGGGSPQVDRLSETPVDEEVLQLTARDKLFDTDTLTVSPGAHVVMELLNMDASPHSFAVYDTPAGSNQIFAGAPFQGPDKSRSYRFDAPAERGTYFFRCDVHPVEMTGDFVVR